MFSESFKNLTQNFCGLHAKLFDDPSGPILVKSLHRNQFVFELTRALRLKTAGNKTLIPLLAFFVKFLRFIG